MTWLATIPSSTLVLWLILHPFPCDLLNLALLHSLWSFSPHIPQLTWHRNRIAQGQFSCPSLLSVTPWILGTAASAIFCEIEQSLCSGESQLVGREQHSLSFPIRLPGTIVLVRFGVAVCCSGITTRSAEGPWDATVATSSTIFIEVSSLHLWGPGSGMKLLSLNF